MSIAKVLNTLISVFIIRLTAPTINRLSSHFIGILNGLRMLSEVQICGGVFNLTLSLL